MEKSADLELKNILTNELKQGRELAKQLQTQLDVSSSSSSPSHESREELINKILNSLDKALSMLNWNGDPPSSSGATIRMSAASPRSPSGNFHSEDSDTDFKDHEHKDGSRMRKNIERLTKQVKVYPGMGLEGPLTDGYSWRKYGQKDILGAKYRRGYYKCTHRIAQGCLATKQVQRSDEDPTIFEITYRGKHTCTQGSSRSIPGPPALPEIQQPNTALDNHQQLVINQPQEMQQQSQEMLMNFQTGLRINVAEGRLDTSNDSTSVPFYSPSTSYVQYSPSILDNNSMIDFSPPLIPPPTSGSNYLSVSSTQMTHFESELNEIVMAAAASATNSRTVSLDGPFGDHFEPTFSFDNPGFFS